MFFLSRLVTNANCELKDFTVLWLFPFICIFFVRLLQFSEVFDLFLVFQYIFSTDVLLLVRFNIKKQDTIFVVLSQYTDQQRTYLPTTMCIFFRHKSLTVWKLYFGSALFDAWIYEHLWSCTCRWFLGLLTMPVNVVRPCFSHQRLWKHS